MSVSDYGGSSTPPEHRDSWRTPPELFAALNNEFDFIGDVAATEHNRLTPLFISEEENALTTAWIDRFFRQGTVWCNPPYSDITPWVKKAADQCKWSGIGCVMLVPADTSVGWFALARQTCTEVRFITAGRVSFVRADTGKTANGNNKGSMLLIWNPMRKAAGMVSFVERDTLLAIGRNIIGQKEKAA